MTYKRFEDLPAWKAAVKFLLELYTFSDECEQLLRRRSDLRSQFERAALSISNNIAEGFERGTTSELVTFLYIARGSAGEVRSMLCVVELLPGFDNLKSQISDLKLQVEAISRQLRAWLEKLQNSDIKGQRYLNDDSRREYLRQREAERIAQDRKEFMDEIRRIVVESRGF
ncbi:MAG TPA: four helix bundle protein [Fimbriimonadaceae bacterium]|nr:four helix bundle protein [Fimbriimonadaceae bacterium]